MYVEIVSRYNTRKPKRGLGLKAEVTGITKEQHQILQDMNWYIDDYGYFKAKILDERRLTVSLHQIVSNMRYEIPILDSTYIEYGYEVDHINNNKYDCRPDNLTYLTCTMNVSKKSKEGKSSIYYGVCKCKNGKWKATCNNKHIGYYKTEEEAARARDKVVRELGLDIMINFP